MAYRTWGRVLLAALGVGLLAGAGQLGFAYGLGVVRFARDFEGAAGQWTAHLAWVAWFAMLAAAAGALSGDWLARRVGIRPSLGSRVACAVGGGVGALAVAPLAMLPARNAEIAGVDAVVIAGLSAALGALAGVFAGIALLSQRVFGLNLAAVTVGVWLIALLSVAPSLGPDDPLPEVRLGVLDATWLGDGLAQRLAVILMPGLALAAGALIGALARWRGLPLVPVAVSGVVGPALLAAAYLIAGPGSGDSDRYQTAPYWGALIAVAAGGLGSVLASVARQLTAGSPATAGGPALEPTDILHRPVPRHGDHTSEIFPGYAERGATSSAHDDEGDRDSFSAFSPSGRAVDSRDPAGAARADGAGEPDWRSRDLADAGTRDSESGARPHDLAGSDPLTDEVGGRPSGLTGFSPRAGGIDDSTPLTAASGPSSVLGSTGDPLFTEPTPVAPPRQPEIVSPPPRVDPTPIRPFDRSPSAGPGAWRTETTSTYASPPGRPLTPEQRPGEADFRPRPALDSDRPTTPTPSASPTGGAGSAGAPGGPTRAGERRDGPSAADRPTAGGPAPRQPIDSGDEMPDWRLAPPAWTPPPPLSATPLRDGPSSAAPTEDALGSSSTGPLFPSPATDSPSGPTAGSLDRRTTGSVGDPTAGSFSRSTAGPFDGPPATTRGGSATGSSSGPTSGSTSSPASGSLGGAASGSFGGSAGGGGRAGDDPESPPSAAKAQPKRRGLFRRKGSAEPAAPPAPPTPTTFAGAGGPPAPSPGDRDAVVLDFSAGRDQAARDLASGRADLDTPGRDAARRDIAGRDATGHDAARHDIASHDAAGRDAAGHDVAGRGAAGRDDRGSSGVSDWAARAGAADARLDQAGRGGDKAGARDRTNRAFDRGDTGSWDIDDLGPSLRGTTAASRNAPAASRTGGRDAAGRDTASGSDATGGAEDGSTAGRRPAGRESTDRDEPTADRAAAGANRGAADAEPSRGRAGRRGRGANDTGELRLDPTPAPAETAEPTRGRGRKGDKPIRPRDEEYVDWVAGLSAPEPVAERPRRDEVPRRSLRSTGRKNDD